ncbi:hypothetical protein LIER_31854 [Lithospermum erythrorhizon]|uniref:Uncharacterized protein n=1 Tax=Lithospermum erythrorhizon TaxID=34254 RepID=A0AAV3RS75_LITER
MRLPFSIFINESLEHLNRALGQIHPIGWLNASFKLRPIICQPKETSSCDFQNQRSTPYVTAAPPVVHFEQDLRNVFS